MVSTVTLRAANPAATSILTRTGLIIGYDGAVATFHASPTAGLNPLLVTFYNDSLYADRFVWNYGDGVTSTVTSTAHLHTYVSPGVYTVTLTALAAPLFAMAAPAR